MRLGNLVLTSPLFLAPMAGITDYPFRRLAKAMGSGLVFTEMISAEGLLRKKETLLAIKGDDHPLVVQLFGAIPEVCADAAELAEAMGADGIDINMGCPARHVTATGAGADLMRFPSKAKKILTEVRRRIQIPLTIKIRSGWDSNQINAVEIAKIAEDSGVNGITLHPRTKKQGFQGCADWGLIREVKRAVTISVLGNGDVTTPAVARKMFVETGCDAVMIGRGALENPWVFRDDHPDVPVEQPSIFPSLDERERMIRYHFHLLKEAYGEKRAFKKIRIHLYWYTRGLPRSASFRSSLAAFKESAELFEALTSYFNVLNGNKSCQFCPSEKSKSITG